MSNGIKLPEINQYNPDLSVPTGGPTISQPDVAGPIAGVALKLAEVVQNYQNQKINTAAKLQKETIKNNSIFDLKQLEQEFENKIKTGEYSGVDNTGKVRNPNQAKLDFEKVTKKYLEKFVKNNSNTPLGQQTIKESYDLLRYQIGESKNKFDDLANEEIKKNAISTYNLNYPDFLTNVENATSSDELKTISFIQLKLLENIKYGLDSETYIKKVNQIKTDTFIKSVSFQANTNDPNKILAYLLSGKPITQDVDLAEEYFQKINQILDPVFGNVSQLNEKDKARLDEITREYEDNIMTGVKKTKTLSSNDPRIIDAIKTLQGQTKVYNEALAENAKINTRSNYQSIRNILEPLRGSTDMKAISAAMQKAYAIANNADNPKQRAELRTTINTYFNVGQTNLQTDRYFTKLAEMGGLTKEFLDELNEAQRLGIISAVDANRYLQTQNKNEAKYKALDKEALKFGVKYLVQKLDPSKLNRASVVINQKDFDITMISQINVNQATLDALQLFHEVMLQGDKDGLAPWEIINTRHKNFVDPVTGEKISALDYTIAISNPNVAFDPKAFPDITDLNILKDGKITISEIEAFGGEGAFVKGTITDVIATEEQRNIAKRRIIGYDENNNPIKETIESRNERVQFYKNYRRAKEKGLTDEELMKIAEFFDFDIRKEVEEINKINPIQGNSNSQTTITGTP